MTFVQIRLDWDLLDILSDGRAIGVELLADALLVIGRHAFEVGGNICNRRNTMKMESRMRQQPRVLSNYDTGRNATCWLWLILAIACHRIGATLNPHPEV